MSADADRTNDAIFQLTRYGGVFNDQVLEILEALGDVNDALCQGHDLGNLVEKLHQAVDFLETPKVDPFFYVEYQQHDDPAEREMEFPSLEAAIEFASHVTVDGGRAHVYGEDGWVSI